MNIFVLDENPRLAAQYHCNKHVVKMIVESAQLLSNAYYHQNLLLLTPNELIQLRFPRERFLKQTHVHHPCTKWASENINNWKWLLELFNNLLSEYTYRYDKIHAMQPLNDWFSQNLPSHLIANNMTPFVKAMPDYIKNQHISTIEAYRSYYIIEKVHITKWSRRSEPYWFVR